MVEHTTENRGVVGSIPTLAILFSPQLDSFNRLAFGTRRGAAPIQGWLGVCWADRSLLARAALSAAWSLYLAARILADFEHDACFRGD